jgi:hypothetical protein
MPNHAATAKWSRGIAAVPSCLECLQVMLRCRFEVAAALTAGLRLFSAGIP